MSNFFSTDIKIKVELFDLFLLLCRGKVNSIRKYLEKLTVEEFLEVNKATLDIEEINTLLFYYFWMFREDDFIIKLINDPKFPNELLIKFIYYGYGQWIRNGHNPDDFFLHSIQFLSPQKCITLLNDSFDIVFNDSTLTLFLITSLDKEHIEYFFKTTKNIQDITEFFSEIFDNLDEEAIKYFFFKNYSLYTYVIKLFQALDPNSKKYKRFFNKYRQYLTFIDEIDRITSLIQNTYDMEKEKKKHPEARNKTRILRLIQEIDTIHNKKEGIYLLNMRGLFLDTNEMDLVESILNNDFLKNTILKEKIQ